MQKYNKHIIEEPVASTVISHRFSHVVWGSVFAGAFVALVSQLILALLGATVGLYTLHLANGNNLVPLSVTEAIWWIISGCISFYLSGLVAGRMAGIPRPLDGMIHGIIAFSVATVFVMFFMTSALGALTSGGFGFLASGMQAASRIAPEIAATANSMMPQSTRNSVGSAEADVRQVMSKLQNPAQRQQLSSAVMALSSTSNPQVQEQQIDNILVQDANMDPGQAQSTARQWAQDAESAKQALQNAGHQVAESTQGASRVAGGVAFASFIMLVLAGFFAGLGGLVGAPHWADQEIV